MADSNSLDGKWIKVLEARNYGGDVSFTRDDLDAAIRNLRSSGKSIPLGEGKEWRNADVHGAIDQLRRDGDVLMGRVSDPSLALEKFYADGGHDKTAVATERTPDGMSIRRVGLVSNGDVKLDGRAVPSTNGVGISDLIFGERRGGLHETRADRLIARLKSAGRWLPEFDELGAPEILRSLEGRFAPQGKPLTACFSEVLAHVAESTQPPGADLHRATLQLQRDRDIGYCEALRMVSEQREMNSRDVFFSEGSPGGNMRGARLHRATRELQDSAGISYGAALTRIAQERPELTRD